MIKAVIFDNDGVIVDTEPFHEKAYRQVLSDFGVEVSTEFIDSIRGRKVEEIFKDSFEKFDIDEDPDKLALEKDKLYRELLKGNVKPLPGVFELMDSLKDFKIALGTSTSPENAELIMNEISIKERFQAIANGNDVEKGKPSPDIYLLAAKRLSVKPEECVVIEDAINGIQAAHNAGMKCIAVTTTFPREKLSEADLIVDSLEELDVEQIKNLG